MCHKTRVVIRFRAKKTTTVNPKFYIGMPVVRTDGRSGGRSVYNYVITKFPRMDRFT